jgi:hypothetical protein
MMMLFVGGGAWDTQKQKQVPLGQPATDYRFFARTTTKVEGKNIFDAVKATMMEWHVERMYPLTENGNKITGAGGT